MVHRSPSLGTSPSHVGSAGFAPVATARLGAEEGLSSSQDSLLAVQRPLRRRVLGHPLQVPGCFPWPSPLFHRLGSLLARLSAGHNSRRLLGLRCRCRPDQLLAPLQGLCCSASTAGSRPTPGAVLPGTLASPRARLALAGCPELVARVVAVDHPLSGSSLQCVPELAGRTEKCCYDNTEVPNLCRPWVCARSPVPCGPVRVQSWSLSVMG